MIVGRHEVLVMPFLLRGPRGTGARVEELEVSFEDYRYRAPYKFGGKEVDRVTLLNVHCRVNAVSQSSGDVDGQRDCL